MVISLAGLARGGGEVRRRLRDSLEGRGVGEMRGSAARDAHAELRTAWAWIQEVAHERQ